MTPIRREYFYTATGPQRPVFFGPETERVRFALEHGTADDVRLQLTYDPVPKTGNRAGAVMWEDHDGGGGGAVYGVTGIRVLVGAVKDWVVLTVEQENKHGE